MKNINIKFDEERLVDWKCNLSMNTSNSEILDNIRQNIRLPLPQVHPFQVNDTPIAIVGGGPSLEDTIDDLRQLTSEGVKVVAVNGSHDYLLDRGIRPSVMVMVDARPFNVRFVENPIPTCKYMIASQCSPVVFDALLGRKANVWIWHSLNKIGEAPILDEHYFGNYGMIVGGSTVLLRAIWLMRVLGYPNQYLFGFDSCLTEVETKSIMHGMETTYLHHAYSQRENDASEVFRVRCAGRDFYCSNWMVEQAKDFIGFVKSMGGHFNLKVMGDGLISHIIETGAKLQHQQG